MWEELTELLIGLAGAGLALAALYYFVAMAQRDQADDDEKPQSALHEPPAPQHEPLALENGEGPPAQPQRLTPGSVPSVAAIYICAAAGDAMRRVPAVEAVARRGLQGDRYFLNLGHWSESDECEVTLITQEDLEQVMRETGISLRDGRHRRNIVTRNIDLASLTGQRFRIGEACFSAARPRPPCLYLQKLTQPGLARALVGRGGIGVHCFKGGAIRDGDPIEFLNLSLSALLRRRWHAWRTDDDPASRRA